ncbi:MAG: TRAP transporter small permease [Inquilinaceae bacterium]
MIGAPPPQPIEEDRAVPPGLRILRTLSKGVSVAMFAALFATFVAQVFWRYVLREPLVWTLEVAGILFVAVSLFTAATQMSIRDHVGLDLFIDALPARLRRILLTISLGLFAAVMILSLPDTVRVLKWMYRERTYAIGFNLGHLFVLMIVFVIVYASRAILSIVQLWRTGQQDEA